MRYTINTSNFKFTDGEYISSADFADYISDNGSLNEDQWLAFDCNGIEFVVNYKLSVSASIYEDRGDYWTAPSCDVEIDNVNVFIDSVYVDEYEVALCRDMKVIFEKFIKSFI